MFETYYRWLPVVAVIVVYVERIREVFTKRKVVEGKKQESLTFNLFMLCGSGIVFGGIVEFWLRGSVLCWYTFIPGIFISIASFAVRRAAIRALGKFWSLHVEMREGHEFVRTGPFAYARHPVYSSMFLELFGIALLVNAWITLLVVLLVFIPTLRLRLRLEEKALVDQFGEAYREYMKVTPAIVPGFPGRREP